MPKVLAIVLLGALDGCGSGTVLAETKPAGNVDLLQMSLEELGKLEVTTVSRKSESLSSAPAAIYVIRPEEIRRWGGNSLPELFRTVPGMDVAQANSRQWAITARGFNEIFANKLLVLLDGRTLYTPLFSGVFWEEADTVLEDLDRIEVIRGPGATVWGANAVNGVINIITKSAKETQGTLISGGGGIEERGFGTVRYGGRLGTNAYYRAYLKHSDHDEFTNRDGTGAQDSWSMTQSGFRIDWEPSAFHQLTFQGDYYYADLAATVARRIEDSPYLYADPFRSVTRGANFLTRWTHALSGDSELSVQAYYDHIDRGFRIAREIRDTFDLDAQHRFQMSSRNEVVWGAGYRLSGDDIIETPDFTMSDPAMRLQLASAFIQDEFTLVPDHLRFTVGTKIEHNDFTGFELQPSARIAWTPTGRHTLWSAVSRAVRTPSRSDRGFGIYVDPTPFLPASPVPILAPGRGNPQFESEKLIAYELGYRFQPRVPLSLDLATFYNKYSDVASVETLPASLAFTPAPSSFPYLVVPLTFRNNLSGESFGVEASTTWQPAPAWRLKLAYTYFKMNLHERDGAMALNKQEVSRAPAHQISAWSDVDLGRTIEWGLGLRVVDELAAQKIPGYVELDTRLAWKPFKNAEVALVGRSLLRSRHLEYTPVVIAPTNTEVDRSIYAKLTLRF